MPLIKRDVPLAGGLEVGDNAVPVAALQALLEEIASIALAVRRRIHPDEREVPVRFRRVVPGHVLEHPVELGLAGGLDRGLKDRVHSRFIHPDPRRQPEGDAAVIRGAERGIVPKGPAAESGRKGGHGLEILVEVRPAPATNRITGEGERNGLNRPALVGLRQE